MAKSTTFEQLSLSSESLNFSKFQKPSKSSKFTKLLKNSTPPKSSKSSTTCYLFPLATILILHNLTSTSVTAARLSTRNGVDTIRSVDNPESLVFLHAKSVRAQKKRCEDIYRNQPNTISSASFGSKSPPVIIIKRTVNVSIKLGGKRYKCKFTYYNGCESRCKKVDKCLKDQRFNWEGSTCTNKKKNGERGGSEAWGTDRSHSHTRRHSRRIGTRIENWNWS